MRRWASLVILCSFLLVSAASAMVVEQKSAQSTTKKSKAVPSKVMTLKGTVVAVGKDSKGNVNAVAIRTDEGDYKVVLKGKGKELLKMVNKKVEATGTVKEAKGKKSINVSEFKEAGA
ncbi:MAG: hypothetical protein ACUVS3_05105 [Thermodesulfobacteriota bacterium]